MASARLTHRNIRRRLPERWVVSQRFVPAPIFPDPRRADQP